MSVTEWDQRQLCPDGACTGLIGADGLCKVCGHVAPNWGDERKRGLEASADDDLDDEGDDYEDDDDGDDDDDEGDDDDGDEEPDEREAGVESTTAVAEPKAPKKGDWQERQLCSDGSCIGVIGDDGKCRTCGKKAAS